MTSYMEQYFLYGDIGMEEPLPSPLTTLIAYSDLTAGAAIIFAAIVLLSLVIGCWGTLCSFVSTGTKKFVLPPIQAILPLLCWYMVEFAYILWHCGFRHASWPALSGRLTRWIADSRAYRLAVAVVDWSLPKNRPLAALCRLIGAYGTGLMVYSSLLVPAARCVSGLVDGWNAHVQSPYCPGAISRYHLNGWLSRDQLSEAYYCLGEKFGLRMHALAINEWLFPSRFGDDGGISHIYALAFVSCTISFIIIAIALYSLLPKATVFQRIKSRLLQPETPYPLGTPITQKESDLWDMISQYEAELDKKKVQLASKSTLLDAAVSELRASRARQEEGWAQVERLADRRNRAMEAQYHEQTLSRHLRQQLVEMTGRLKVAEGRLRDERQELADAHSQIADQRKQLSEEQEELDRGRQELSDDQRLADGRQNLVEEQTRLDGVREQLAVAHQQLAEERQRLVTEHQKHAQRQQGLVQDQERLAHEHQELINQNSQLSISLEASQQEQNAALAQVMSLQLDLDSTNMTASITYAHSQESLSRAQQAESTLQQAMADLKSACDQSLAQERAASQGARRQASALSAEVNDLQTQIGMAMRDAQRSHEQATNAQGTISMLEHRLARHEAVQNGSTQEIPKRQTGNTKSVATALAEKEVTVAAQMAEIANLKRQLERVMKEAPTSTPQSADPAVKEGFQKLRAALEKERRARTEDNVRWGSKTRDLEADNQKLRISLSNATAQGGSLHPSTPRRSPARP